jgi:hypothetical protein
VLKMIWSLTLVPGNAHGKKCFGRLWLVKRGASVDSIDKPLLDVKP